MRLGVVLARVVRVARGHHRLPGVLRELRELGVDPSLDVEARVLDLDVDVVRAEDLHESVELATRSGQVVLTDQAADGSRQAARQGDDPVGVLGHQLVVDARAAVVALEVPLRAELDEVVVALRVLGEQRDVRAMLAARTSVAIGNQVRLEADDRRDAALACLAVQLDGAAHDAVVGQRRRRLAQLLHAIQQPVDTAGSIQDGVVGVDVEVRERSLAGHGR
ncbi:MAG: hypothetical protein R2878_11435 [Thermoleophilia bacterium]